MIQKKNRVKKIFFALIFVLHSVMSPIHPSPIFASSSDFQISCYDNGRSLFVKATKECTVTIVGAAISDEGVLIDTLFYENIALPAGKYESLDVSELFSFNEASKISFFFFDSVNRLTPLREKYTSQLSQLTVADDVITLRGHTKMWKAASIPILVKDKSLNIVYMDQLLTKNDGTFISRFRLNDVSNPPYKVTVYYPEPVTYPLIPDTEGFDTYPIPEYGLGVDPEQYARQVIKESTAQYDYSYTEPSAYTGSGYTDNVEAGLLVSGYDELQSLTNRPTRTLTTLPDADTIGESPSLSKYGGRMDKRIGTGTGFFRTIKQNGRWWLVDPEGYLFYSMGMNTVAYIKEGGEDVNVDEINTVYGGSVNEWADSKRNAVLADGFNTAGGWSMIMREWNKSSGSMTGSLHLDAVDGKNPMPVAAIIPNGVGIGVAQTIGGVNYGNSTWYIGGVPMVFNPDFEMKCRQIIKKNVTPHKDNPYIIGWWSDNEINERLDMLDSALNLDPTEPLHTYTYAAAWEWLRERTGNPDADINSVNDTLREEFREFVYDRYYRIISKAFKDYAPNHLYLGTRHAEYAVNSVGIYRAAARYCDVISFNLYKYWTPNVVDTWAKYADKPVWITEAYANVNSAAAGWVVGNQQDRGKFYENFTLRLFEAPNVVGFHWFSSGNYFNQNGQSYLSKSAKAINQKVYPLIDFFDK